jgi:hypothetical protein
VPGITIGPNGIAEVHPTVKPTAGPSGTGTVGVPPGRPTVGQTTVDDRPPPTSPVAPQGPSTAGLTTPPATDSSTPPPQITDTAADPAGSEGIASAPAD